MFMTLSVFILCNQAPGFNQGQSLRSCTNCSQMFYRMFLFGLPGLLSTIQLRGSHYVKNVVINFYLAASAVQSSSIYLVRVMNLAALRHNCAHALLSTDPPAAASKLLVRPRLDINCLRVLINFPILSFFYESIPF